MKVIFRPEAQQELLEEQNWYAARAIGLGFEFSRAVDAAISKVQRMPFAFAHIEGEFRHVVTRKFPYSIIYHASSTEIIVISVFHHRRKPKTWLQRTKG